MGSRVLSVALLALAITPNADPSDCQTVAANYSAALASVTEALRAYEACLSASRGRNQCATEFEELDAAHLDYEDAVAEYHRACPPVPHDPH
jgi:hypothetical protein